MAGKLYVDEIRDTATTGSPSFPNGLDITELTDPVGREGEVLTVQADGSIAAAEASGGGGWPLAVAVADVEDAAVIGAALVAATGVVGTAEDGSSYHSVVSFSFLSPDKSDRGEIDGSYASGNWVFSWSNSFHLTFTGAGTLYLFDIWMFWEYHGRGPE